MDHVVCTHVVDDVDAGFGCQQRSVAELDGQRLIRSVEHSLAMEADQVDIFGLQVLPLQEKAYRVDMT